MTFYVYALLDPRKEGPFKYGRWTFTHSPFYIGKGCGDRVLRHLSLSASKHRGNTAKLKIVESLASRGLQPIVTIKKSDLSETDAFNLERSLILTVGRLDLKTGPLTNKTSGGQGVQQTDAQRRANSKRVAKHWDSLSAEEQSSRNLKKAEGLRRYYATLSEDAKAARKSSLKSAWAKCSKTERMNRARKISETQLNISSEERARRFEVRSAGQMKSKGLMVEYKGRTYPFIHLWRLKGRVSYSVAYSRFKNGVPIAKALSYPVGTKLY